LLEDQELELTAYEYKVIEYLVMNSDKVISKTELTEHIYDQDFDRDSNVIEVFVGRLRKKLDPDGKLKPIETLRGRGYRWNLERINNDEVSTAS
jgi:two-component system response regulator PhoP